MTLYNIHHAIPTIPEVSLHPVRSNVGAMTLEPETEQLGGRWRNASCLIEKTVLTGRMGNGEMVNNGEIKTQFSWDFVFLIRSHGMIRLMCFYPQ